MKKVIGILASFVIFNAASASIMQAVENQPDVMGTGSTLVPCICLNTNPAGGPPFCYACVQESAGCESLTHLAGCNSTGSGQACVPGQATPPGVSPGTPQC